MEARVADTSGSFAVHTPQARRVGVLGHGPSIGNQNFRIIISAGEAI